MAHMGHFRKRLFVHISSLALSSFVTIMCLSVGGCWAVIQIYSLAWIRLIAVSATLLIHYFCLR